jgi:hypothetical protein
VRALDLDPERRAVVQLDVEVTVEADRLVVLRRLKFFGMSG